MLNSLAEKCPELMKPVVDCEYPLEKASEAHVEVIEHAKGTLGRILINPNL